MAANPEPKIIPTYPRKYWDNIWLFMLFAIVFWILQFCLQYFWLSEAYLDEALVRSCAFTGATLFVAALLSSVIFKLFPRAAIHWHLRRHLCTSAFTFLALHGIFVTWFYFKFNLAEEFASLNPLENPLIFGSLALPIIFVMAATSTDYAKNKLSPKAFKILNAFVYLGFILSLTHMTLVNPSLLITPPGILLIALIITTVLGQIYWLFSSKFKKN